MHVLCRHLQKTLQKFVDAVERHEEGFHPFSQLTHCIDKLQGVQHSCKARLGFVPILYEMSFQGIDTCLVLLKQLQAMP